MAVYGSNYIYGDSYYKDLGVLPDDSHVPVDYEYYLVSFTLAVHKEQGLWFSENTGDDCLFVEPGFNGMQIEDANGIMRHLAFHDRKGYITDPATKKGPINSDQVKVWQDGVDSADENGTDVEPSVRFGSDEGTFEHFWIMLTIAHFFLRAADAANRGATGYDSAGFPTGLELDLGVFVDGERSTASRSVTDIPITGDVHTEAQVEGYRIAHELSANMGAHSVIGRKVDYVVNDRPVGSGVMTEDGYCEDLSKVYSWFSRGLPYTDRATGIELSSSIQDLITLTTGVDWRSFSGWRFSEALALSTVSLAGNAILFWGQNISSLTIRGVAIPLLSYATQISDRWDDDASWTLYYVLTTSRTGEVTITPTGTGKLFDYRILRGVTLTVAALNYYFNNINDHEGDVVLP